MASRFVVYFAAFVIPGVAMGATLYVPGEYETLNEALDASGPGDTVLVAPGTYTDYDSRYDNEGLLHTSCAFLKGGVTLRASAGPMETEIRLEETVGFPSVVDAEDVTTGDEMRVEGFTISGGLDNMILVSLVDSSPRVTIANCWFEHEGLALVAVGGTRTHLEVRDCWFSGYPTAVGHNDERLVVEDCVFEDGERAIRCDDAFDTNYMSLEVRRCEFRRNTGSSGASGGVSCSFYDSILVEACLFEDCGGGDGDGGIDAVAAPGGSISVQGCTFVRDSLTGGRRGAGAILDGQTVEVIGNTFYRCTQEFASPGGAAVYFRHSFTQGTYSFLNNVVVECETVGGGGPPVAVGNGGTGISNCNVFWANPGGTVGGLVSGPQDVEVDPLFCDSTNDDFTVQEGSPCLPHNSNGCGLIGAHSQGCGVISVEDESWAGIKARYKNGR